MTPSTQVRAFAPTPGAVSLYLALLVLVLRGLVLTDGGPPI